jgi:hypothetical protein
MSAGVFGMCRYNVGLNEGVLRKANCSVRALDWEGPAAAALPTADVIIGAEVVYDGMSPKALTGTFVKYLSKPEGVAYVAVMTEARGNVDAFQAALMASGFTVDVEGIGKVCFSKEEEAELGFPLSVLKIYSIAWAPRG